MNQKRHKAFTLVEVLFALALFALGAAVLGAAYVNALTAYERARTAGNDERDRVMIRRLVMSEPDRMAVESGDEAILPVDRRARWRAEVVETTIPDLFDVTVHTEVFSPDAIEPRIWEETFRLMRPTWSDPVRGAEIRRTFEEQLANRANLVR